MAPSKAKSSSGMKQKSLLGWLSQSAGDIKPSQKPSNQANVKSPRPNASNAHKFDPNNSKTSGVGGGSDPLAKDESPTREVTDVDMLSVEDEHDQKGHGQINLKAGRVKRKMVVEDYDEEDACSLMSYPTMSQTKKLRVSSISAADDDHEEDEEELVLFSSRLTRFKRSPSGLPRKSQTSDNDDESHAPSESSIPAYSHNRSSSCSSTPSRRSFAGDSDEGSVIADDAGDLQPERERGKATSRPLLDKGGVGSSNSGGSGFSFLTAAERREQKEQGEKDDKRAAESPYSFLQDVKDKDGLRPGETGYDPRTLFIPKSAWKEFTPLEKQFWEIKQNHYDTVLFFQKGKFWELYEDDARIGHTEFDLRVTRRVKMSMVGFPESSFGFWAAKFLGKGYKVGRVNQTETALGAEIRLGTNKPKGKTSEDQGKDKILQRTLYRVYTNGTLVDDELLTDEHAGHCISIREGTADETDAKTDDSFGICVLDSSTSEFSLSAFEDDICRTKLETMLRQLRPKEIVFTKGNLSVTTTRLLKSILAPSCLWTSLRENEGFGYDRTVQELNALYPAEHESMEDGILSEMVPQSIRDMLECKRTIEALGAMIWYLRHLNIDKDILSMKNFDIYDPMKKGRGLVLDGQTLSHIEVLLNSEGTEEGSLLKLLSRCITPFGKRLFRIWLCKPLCEVSDINARLDAVQDLLDHPAFEQEFTDVTKGLPDLERIVSRIHAKNCKVKDFFKVLSAFRKLSGGLNNWADASETFKSKTVLDLFCSAPDLSPNIKNIQAMFRKPDAGGDELVPVDGKNEVYDSIMTKIAELERDLAQQLKKFEKSLGCSLTYWHSAQCIKDIYLVQTKVGQKNIPKEWAKRGATKTVTRWFVPSLQDRIRSLKEARENRNTTIKNFKFRLFEEFDSDRGVWLRAVRVLAELDCLLSLAKSSDALGNPICRPEFVEGNAAWVEFKDLRHPALCMRQGLGDFIPNNVKLGLDVGRIALLTGPNMGGKSTVMRMTAAGIIMAQLGMFVPAESARLCPVDAILTRMGAYDNMFSNASTFKVELDECCKILRDATPKSFVILDELGRGTSTYDGMAIAGAVLHQLATHTLPLSFFATHYGSLTDDFAYHPNIRNMHMATLVDDDKYELVFLYKLVEGIASSSFGTHVANLAGVPMDVVRRAETVSEDFARQSQEKLEGKRKNSVTSKLPLVAQADFAYLYGLATSKLTIPQDSYKQQELLRGLREAARKHAGSRR